MASFPWLERLNHMLWNGPLLWLMLGLGVWFTIRSGFYPVRRCREVWRFTFGSLLRQRNRGKTGISPFAAVSTALAGTIGTGNIAGVAVALTTGGPGAVFWMWVSAFFGMMTKHTEIRLAVQYRVRETNGGYCGGPMQYMERGLGSKPLAVIFALLCALASFGIGNMAQIHEAARMTQQAFGLSPVWTGAGVAALCAVVLLGGGERIAGLNAKLVPAMGLFYVAGALLCLAAHPERLGPAFGAIFSHAFSPAAAAGGAGGYALSRALRVGLARGVFTNEAGMGSAPIAHAAALSASPEHQAAWGVMEVALDTLVMCTLTALVLLTAGPEVQREGLSGAALTARAFSLSLGGAAEWFLAVSMVSFAAASILGWAFYGQRAVRYLFPGPVPQLCYRLLFLLAIPVGAVCTADLVWSLSDLLNGLMALPNLLALFLLTLPGKARAKHQAPSAA